MVQTDAELLIRAAQVADETAPGANTAIRVGEILEDFVDSKVNVDKLPKIYKAVLTQSGASDPTVVVAKNDFGGTSAWTRTGAGFGRFTNVSGPLTAGKTIVSICGAGSGGYSDVKLFSAQVSSVTNINIGAFRASDQTAEDGYIVHVLIEVYP